MGNPSSLPGQHGTADSQNVGLLSGPQVPRQRSHRTSRSSGSSRRQPRPPDLAAIAREAVVRYLNEATARTAESDAVLGDGATPDLPVSGIITSAEGPSAAQDVAVRAAAISVATLDRIEAAAAKLETDIAAARQEQAKLQAGAGRAAAEAIRSAQEATAASFQAKRALRLIGRYLAITLVLVIVQLVILVLFAGAGH